MKSLWNKFLILLKIRKPQKPPVVITYPTKKPDSIVIERPDGKTPYDIATQEMGVKEVRGDKHNPRILEYHSTTGGFRTDEISWCSSFVNFCAMKAGYERSHSGTARSWAKVGIKIKIEDAREGDVAVFGRPRSWKGHVTFIKEVSSNRKKILGRGGNQSNRVNDTWYSVNGYKLKLVAIVRLDKQVIG